MLTIGSTPNCAKWWRKGSMYEKENRDQAPKNVMDVTHGMTPSTPTSITVSKSSCTPIKDCARGYSTASRRHQARQGLARPKVFTIADP